MDTDSRLTDLRYLADFYHQDYNTMVRYMPESVDEYEEYVAFLQTIMFMTGNTHDIEDDEMEELVTWAEGNPYGYPTDRLRSSLLPNSLEGRDEPT